MVKNETYINYNNSNNNNNDSKMASIEFVASRKKQIFAKRKKNVHETKKNSQKSTERIAYYGCVCLCKSKRK